MPTMSGANLPNSTENHKKIIELNVPVMLIADMKTFK